MLALSFVFFSIVNDWVTSFSFFARGASLYLWVFLCQKLSFDTASHGWCNYVGTLRYMSALVGTLLLNCSHLSTQQSCSVNNQVVLRLLCCCLCSIIIYVFILSCSEALLFPFKKFKHMVMHLVFVIFLYSSLLHLRICISDTGFSGFALLFVLCQVIFLTCPLQCKIFVGFYVL